MEFNSKDVFGSVEQVLDDVIVLPYGVYEAGHEFTLTNATWSDFESVMSTLGNTFQTEIDSHELTKEGIDKYPNNWAIHLSGTDSSGNTLGMRVEAISATRGRIVAVTGAHSDSRVLAVIAKKKRYSTQNVAKTITVNNGNAIGLGYEGTIDIASALGSEFVGRRLMLQAQIFNNDGTGKEIYFESALDFWQDSGGNSRSFGVGVDHDETTISIFAGTDALSGADRPKAAGHKITSTQRPVRLTCGR